MAQVTSGSIASGSHGFTNNQGVYNTNWLELHWRRSSVSGQVSTIQWCIRFVGSGSPLERTKISQCRLRITPVTGTLKIGSTTYSSMTELVVLPYNSGRSFYWSTIYPNEGGWAPAQGDSSYSVNWDNESRLGGTFTVTHSNGVGKFTLQLQANIYEHGSNGWDGTYNTPAGTAVTFELPVTTTACGAPTSVTASGIVTPSGSFTVSWSGATAGTGNAITGYYVYWRVSSGGSAPTTSTYTGVSAKLNSNISSYSVSLSSATRGYKVVCGVVTVGTVSGFNSGIKTGGSVTINSLPTAPTLNKSSQTIASGSTGVTVTATKGTDVDTSQTLSVYYNSSNSHTNQTKGTSVTINPDEGSSSTFYFWTYDGLEYSSATTITITKNSKPEITTATTVITYPYTVGGSDGVVANQCSGFVYCIQPKIRSTKAGTLHIIPQTTSDTPSASASWTTRAEYSTVSVTANTDKTLTTYDIHEKLSSYPATRTSKIYWRLAFYVNDGIENSDTVYLSGDYYAYAIAGAPSSITVYNSHNGSNISGTNSGQIGTKVGLAFPYDSSMPAGLGTVVSVTATKTGDTNTSYTVTLNSLSYSGNTMELRFTLPDNIPSATALTFNAILQTSDGQRQKSFSATATETKKPTMGTLTYSPSTIKPFSVSESTSIAISMPWPFGTSNPTTLTEFRSMLSEYNCSTTTTTSIKFIEATATSGTNSYDATEALTIQLGTSSNSSRWKRNSDTLYSELLSYKAYPFNNALGITSHNYTGTLTYYAVIKITNLFGQTFYSSWTSARTFNFNEKVSNVTITDLCWRKDAPASTSAAYDDTKEVALTGSNYVMEGVYLRFKVNCTAYSTDNISLTSTQLTQQTISASRNITTISDARSGIAKTFICTYQIPEVTTTSGITVSLNLVTNGGSVLKSTTVPALRLTTGNITLNDCTIANGYFDGSYTVTDHGIDATDSSTINTKYSSHTWRLFDISGSPSYTAATNFDYSNAYPITSTFHSQNINNTTWTAITVRMRGIYAASISGTARDSSTTITSSAKTKYTYSNNLSVYKDAPTVAYRANQIGINEINPENYSTAAVIVTAHSGKEKIILHSASKTITIDLQEGRIY